MSALQLPLEKMLGKTMLFFHHSVGGDMLQGIRELQRNGSIYAPVRIVEIKAAGGISFSGMRAPDSLTVLSISVGKNRDPAGKISGMTDVIRAGWGDDTLDYYMSKLCYVDFDASTDTEEILRKYMHAVDTIRLDHPSVVALHCTTPVKARGSSGGLKGMFSFFVNDRANRKRNEYNRMLMEVYENSAPVFDLAGVEAGMTSEGGREKYLVSDYTDDGGHLNAKGRALVGRAFLEFLQNLQNSK